MICPSCSRDVHPYDDMGTDMRVVSRCPRADCNSIFPSATLEAERPRPPVQAATRRADNAAPPRASFDVLGLAKARLVTLEGELSALESKRAEAAMLRRMIYAAELTEDHNEDHLDA